MDGSSATSLDATRVTVVPSTGSGAATATPAYTAAQKRRQLASILVASGGNLTEWFGFYTYAYCSIYFAPAFFPAADPTGQLLNTAGVFAAGFIMRPLGGWLFGRLADRNGRRYALVLSVLSMCVGSLIIAFTPAYSDIGPWAPAVLLLGRLIQGLSVGGEYGTAATYLSEVALRRRRGLYSSFQYVALIGGQLSASLVVVVLQQVLSDAELKSWGWRIPFAIGAASALAALILRLRLRETSSDEARYLDKAGSVGAIWREHRAASITVLGYTAGASLIFYTFTTYMQKFLVNSAGMSIGAASAVMTACLFAFMCVQPLFGALSDRIGRRRNMLIFGAAGTVFPVPILIALHHLSSPLAAFLLISCILLIISFYTSVSGIVKAEMFPIEVRALGVGFPYAIANAVFGGSAEYVALASKAIGRDSLFYVYVAGMMGIVFLASLRLPSRAPYLHDGD